MRILLIEPNIRSYALLPPISLPALKGFLNTWTTHHASILDLVFHKPDWQTQIIKTLEEERPDVVGLSVLSFNYPEALSIAGFIKEHSVVPIIFGGVHVILSPDEVIGHPEVDMICTGEGELTLKALLDNGGDPQGVDGLWFKHHGEVHKNPPRPLAQDIDAFGFPDFSDFDMPRYFFINHHHVPIMASRGCPYSCTYCSNHALKNALKEPYVRFRTVDSIIQEIDLRVEQYAKAGMRFLYFFDDTFILDPRFITSFCQAYKAKGYHEWLPWNVNVRANLVTEDLMRMMKDAGCYQVRMGVESGNEQLRNTVYRRNMTNQQIDDAFTAIHHAGLQLRLYFIVGAPQETLAMMQESLALAKQASADEVFFGLLYPLPGTEIQQICRQTRILNEPQDAISESIGPVSRTLTVSPRQLRRFMRSVARWQVTHYLTEGYHLKGPRFLLDSLWFAVSLKHAYDFESNQLLRWNVQGYKLDVLYQK